MAKRTPIRNADDPIKVAPPPPAELCPAGQALWELTARSLVKAGHLTYGDLVGLRTMCQTEDLKEQAYSSVCELGVTIIVKTAHGSERAVPNPAATAYAKLAAECPPTVPKAHDSGIRHGDSGAAGSSWFRSCGADVAQLTRAHAGQQRRGKGELAAMPSTCYTTHWTRGISSAG